MAISELPASPAGEITHGQVRTKINEVIQAFNAGEFTSIVTVRGDDDLPAVVGGFSDLEANTYYWFMNGVTITKNLRVQVVGVTLAGLGIFSEAVTFTGTGDFLTINDFSVHLENLRVVSSAGNQFINATGAIGNTTLRVDDCQFSGGAKLGTLNNVTPAFGYFVALSFEDGFTFTGTFTGFTFRNCFLVDNSASAVHFDLGSAVFSDLKMDEVTTIGSGQSISSSVNGANIAAGIEAYVSKCTFNTPVILNGFPDQFQTNQWEFLSNSPLSATEDTDYVCDQYLVPATPVVVSVAAVGVFYEIGAPPGPDVWQSDLAKHYTPNADGSVTYTGAKPIDTEIFYTESLDKVGGGTAQLEVRLAINWTAGQVGLAKSRTVTRNNNEASVTGSAEVTLSPGDNVRLIRANNGTTADINVYNSKMDFKK